MENENVVTDFLSQTEVLDSEKPSNKDPLKALSSNTVFGGTAFKALCLHEVATATRDDMDLSADVSKCSTD